MAVSEAQKKASANWDKDNMEFLRLKLKIGIKDKWKAIAENADQSLTSFIADAVKEKALREGLLTADQAASIMEKDLEGTWVKAYQEA